MPQTYSQKCFLQDHLQGNLRAAQNFPALKTLVLTQHHLIAPVLVMVLVQEMTYGSLWLVVISLQETGAPLYDSNK